MTRLGTLAALALVAGCAPRYTYTFTPEGSGAAAWPGGPDTIDDADLRLALRIDAQAAAVELDVTNKTDQVLAVKWSEIAVTQPDGRVTALRPSADLGWIEPGTALSASLLPLALPHTGDAARAYEGRTLRIDVPVVVRREPRTYHFTLASHVKQL